MSRINVKEILLAHDRTLRNESTKTYDLDVIFGYLVVPLIVSIALVYLFKFTIDASIGAAIIMSMSVLAGLMFNLLVLIFDVSNRIHESLQSAIRAEDARLILKKELTVELMQDTFINISFGVLLAIAILIFSTIATVVSKPQFIKDSTSFVTFFLLVGFLYTLLMILKRLYVLLSQEVGVRAFDIPANR